MNFLGMGSLEILTVFIIAFLILGPTKMIGMGKEIGKFVRDARKMGSDLQNSITEGNEKPIKSLRSLVDFDEVALDDESKNPIPEESVCVASGINSANWLPDYSVCARWKARTRITSSPNGLAISSKKMSSLCECDWWSQLVRNE